MKEIQMDYVEEHGIKMFVTYETAAKYGFTIKSKEKYDRWFLVKNNAGVVAFVLKGSMV